MHLFFSLFTFMLAAFAQDPRVEPDTYCGRLLVESGLALEYPYPGTLIHRNEVTRYELWALGAGPAEKRRAGFEALAKRARQSFDQTDEHDRWRNLQDLVLFAQAQGWRDAALREARFFAERASAGPIPQFGLHALRGMLVSLRNQPEPELHRTLAGLLGDQVRWQRALWPLALVRSWRAQGLSPELRARILAWAERKGDVWAKAAELRELIAELQRDGFLPRDLAVNEHLSEREEGVAARDALLGPAGDLYYFLDALRSLPPEYRSVSDQYLAWLTSTAVRAQKLGHQVYREQTGLPRMPGERLLDYAGRVAALPRANPDVDHAQSLQKPLVTLVRELLGTFPEEATRLIPWLDPSAGVTALYARAAEGGFVPNGALGEWGEAWERSARETALYLYEHRQNREPDWVELGVFDAEPSVRGVPVGEAPSERFRTSHYLMRNQLGRIVALARSEDEAHRAQALGLLAALSADPRPVPSAFRASHGDEPFRSLGFDPGQRVFTRTFRALDFKINAYLTVAGLIPAHRGELTRQALALARSRPAEAMITNENRREMVPVLATSLRLANALLEVGAAEESLRVAHRPSSLLRALPEAASPREVADQRDLAALRRFAYLTLPARTLSALRAAGGGSPAIAGLVSNLENAPRSFPEDQAGEAGELAFAFLGASEALTSSEDVPLARTLFAAFAAAIAEEKEFVRVRGAERLLRLATEHAGARQVLERMLAKLEPTTAASGESPRAPLEANSIRWPVVPAEFRNWRGTLFELGNGPRDTPLRRQARRILRAHYGIPPTDKWRTERTADEIVRALSPLRR